MCFLTTFFFLILLHSEQSPESIRYLINIFKIIKLLIAETVRYKLKLILLSDDVEQNPGPLLNNNDLMKSIQKHKNFVKIITANCQSLCNKQQDVQIFLE